MNHQSRSCASGAVHRRNAWLPPAALRALLVAAAFLAAPPPAAAGPGAACEIEHGFTRRLCASEGLAGPAFVRGVNCRIVEIDGFPREYIVYVPENPSFDLEEPLPLVFMFHGSSGDAVKFLKISGWTEKAEEVGLVVVYPTALEHKVLDSGRCTTKWSDYTLPNEIDPDVKPRTLTPGGAILEYPPGAPWPPDDVSFARAMTDDVSAGVPVDTNRFYLAGFSSGANFAARLAVELSDRFAAAAWVGGGLVDPHPPDARRMPVAIALGQCDDRVAERLAIPLDRAGCVAGAPNGGGLDLDPASWLALPGLESFVTAHLESFALDPAFDAVGADETLASVTWRTPLPANFDGNRLKLTVLARVTHQFPRCTPARCNNPHGFSAADQFWQYFSQYTLASCTAP